jgi:nickel transport protein
MVPMNRFVPIAVVMACLTSAAGAHTVWLEPAGNSDSDYRVMFGGHAGKKETYKPEKLKSVDATDAKGNALKISRDVTADGVLLHVNGTPAIITMHFDNGIHSRGDSGPSVEKPMNEVPGAKRATYAVKYHKTIVAWSPRVTKPLDQPFEVIPLEGSQPRAGQPMKVRVLQQGKPVAGVKLGRGEEGSAADPVTDADGVAVFIPAAGFNKLWAGKRTPVSGDPKYTELSYEYLLGFNAK